MSDPGITYRSRDEVAGVRKARDPVATVKTWLLGEAGMSADEVKALEMSVRETIDLAVAEAKRAEPPPSSELTRDIFVGPYEPPRMCNL